MNKYLTTSVLATALFSSSVFADSNFYLGASVGQSDVDYGEFSSFFTDDEDTSWRVFGGYKFNQNLAVELAYQDFGENFGVVSGTPFKADGDAISVALVGTLPLKNNLALFGKVGFADGDINYDAAAISVTASEGDEDVLYGVGLTYGLTETVDLRLEWEHIDTEYEVDTVSFGVSYNF